MKYFKTFETFEPRKVDSRDDRFKSMVKGTVIFFYDPKMSMMKGVEMFWSKNTLTGVPAKTKQVMYDAYMEIHNGPIVDVDSLSWNYADVTGFFWIQLASEEDMKSSNVQLEFFNNRDDWFQKVKYYNTKGITNYAGNLLDLNTTTL